MLPPLVKLATCAAPGEAKYVCLAGAGLSKDAGLPTSWDLMLATAAHLRAAEPDPGEGDLQSWFLDSRYKDMSYSELIGGMFSSSVEQQSFIREKLRAEKPGKAHTLLAELAKRRVLRCIITTNFDDLIERALVDAGLSVQVITTDEDLDHSEPIIHCKQFRVYKPHGTIGVGRLRNTPTDLKRLSKKMERELARVLRDHGLMVLGYSGSDESILSVLRRRKQRSYPTFWVNPSEPHESVPPLFAAETYNYVPCRGASAVLADLLDMYRRLMALAPSTGASASVFSVRQSVQEERPGAGSAVREFLATATKALEDSAPDLATSGEVDELLVRALEATKPLVVEFAHVFNAVAQSGSAEYAGAVYKAFGGILENYQLKPGSPGNYSEHQFDYFKFIGHELFVMFFAALIREGRWNVVGELLGEGIYVRNAEGYKADVVHFEYVSEYISLIDYRNRKLSLRRACLHSDLLYDRHKTGELADASPHDDFTEADYLLSLKAWKDAGDDFVKFWRPWSVLRMPGSGPRFLLEAKARKNAERVAGVLGVDGIEGLKVAVVEQRDYLRKLFNAAAFWSAPPDRFNPAEIGSR